MGQSLDYPEDGMMVSKTMMVDDGRRKFKNTITLLLL